MVTHANRYDTIEVWCESEERWADGNEIAGCQGPPDTLDEVTCRPCLDAIMKYGGLAMARSLDLAAAMIEQMKAESPGIGQGAALTLDMMVEGYKAHGFKVEKP